MTKNLIFMTNFLCQIKILLLNMLKNSGFLFKILYFLGFFFISQDPGFFLPKLQIPGFFMFF